MRRLPIWLCLLLTDLIAHAQPPYPPSPVIDSVYWAPPETIIRLGDDSDNWPVTWADDDVLYTAYGDGTGFEPKPERKLSLGFARIIGSPPRVSAENITPTNADFTGHGRTGHKASGLLAIGNTLYLWIRNADRQGNGCRLGRSDDKGKHWQWSDWQFDSLGYCTFLNFGRGYRDARDGYVYVYSNDGPSAYRNADHFVLLRAPVDRLMQREAWQFFAGLSDETVRWTQDFDSRQSVFRHAGRARRSSVIYNAAIGRYLWWQQNSESGQTRFAGGFGLYDAPQPWGPWTTVYFTERWDVGPGETATFPVKWISDDGRTLWLVFSGDDKLSIRRLTLNILPR